jgi:hypothetical protein
MRLIPKHQQAGYVTPQARPCCRNCTFMTGEENGLNQVTYWSCRKHGFEVRTGGICPDHPRAAAVPGIASPLRGPRAVALQVEQSPVWGADDLDDESPEWGGADQVEQAPAGAVWPGRGNDAESMRKRGGLTVAQHSRQLVLQLIANEEASGDPQLLRAAVFRRRSMGMEPRA